jgi:hypothetical protein
MDRHDHNAYDFVSAPGSGDPNMDHGGLNTPEREPMGGAKLICLIVTLLVFGGVFAYVLFG